MAANGQIDVVLDVATIEDINQELAAKADASAVSNVDNTADAAKPVSAAQQTALDLKADASAVSNVDNTSDASKPVSTAQQTALLEQTNQTLGLAATAIFIARVEVDQKAGLIYFPRMVFQRPDDATVTAAGGVGNGFVSVALNTSPTTFTYVYLDTADIATNRGIKVSSDKTFGKNTATTIPLGTSTGSRYAPITPGQLVRHSHFDPFPSAVSLRGISQGYGFEGEVEVDYARSIVRFPRMLLTSWDFAAGLDIAPEGGAGYKELPLSEDATTTYYYYIDITGGSPYDIISATNHATEIMSRNLVYLGQSTKGRFSSPHGLPVKYLQSPTRRRYGELGTQAIRQQREMVISEPSVFDSRQPETISSNKWVAISPTPQVSAFRFNNASGGKADLQWAVPSSIITIQSTNGLDLYAGTDGFFGGNTTAAISGACVVEVRTFGYDQPMVLNVIQGAAPTYSATVPTYDFSYFVGGQSVPSQWLEFGSGPGNMRATRDAQWVGSGNVQDWAVEFIPGSTGGTAILKASNPAASSWWLDDGAAGAARVGPALQDALDAIAAAADVPTEGFWNQGQSDVAAMQDGTITISRLQDGIEEVMAELRTAAPSLELAVVQIGGRAQASYEGHAGVHAAYWAAIDNLAYLHHGPEAYDLPLRADSLHLYEQSYNVLASRLARDLINMRDATTLSLGPDWTAEVASSNPRVAIITPGSSAMLPPDATGEAGEDNLQFPFGFGARRPGETAADSTLVPQRGTVNALGVITLEFNEDLIDGVTAATIIYPEGGVPNAARANWPLESDADEFTGVRGMPLRSDHKLLTII